MCDMATGQMQKMLWTLSIFEHDDHPRRFVFISTIIHLIDHYSCLSDFSFILCDANSSESEWVLHLSLSIDMGCCWEKRFHTWDRSLDKEKSTDKWIKNSSEVNYLVNLRKNVKNASKLEFTGKSLMKWGPQWVHLRKVL